MKIQGIILAISILCIILSVVTAAGLRDPGNIITVSPTLSLLTANPLQGPEIIPSVRTPLSEGTGSALPSYPYVKSGTELRTVTPDIRNVQSVNVTPTATTIQPAVTQKPEKYAPERVIVKYKDEVASQTSSSKSRIATANAGVGATTLKDYSAEGLPGMQLVQVAGITVPEAVNRYKKLPIVEYAEPDYLLSIIDESPVSRLTSPKTSTATSLITTRPGIPEVQIPGNSPILQNPPLVAQPPVGGIPVRTRITTVPTPVGTIQAGGSEIPQLAPVSDGFLDYMNSGQKNTLISGDKAGGFIPSPVNFTHLKGKHLPHVSTSYPAAFDLRTSNKVTAVRDQGNCGSCWAHGTYGSLESVMMPTVSDFSENNLKNTPGFNWGPCDGGNNYISMAYLGRWSGPVAESSDPYRPDTTPSPPNLPVTGHVQEVIQLPQKSNPLDNDNIKWALTTYGGISVSYYHSSSSYSSTYAAYYYPYSTYANHIVTIIGWDDNFLKTRFPTTPAGNGAFLCKNSWGTSWGQSGYYWVSYYDMTMGYDELFTYMPAAPPSNFARSYQYDPYGWVYDDGYGTPTAYFANIFTATTSEQLTAVGFYTPDTDCQYEIKVYTGASGGPISGSLRQTYSGFMDTPGYHTVAIPAVSLTAGEKFSVVVRITTTGYGYPVAIEYPYPGYSSGATASPGQSYISSNGVTFTDITSWYANTNVCLKAFTTANGSPTPTQSMTPTPTPTTTVTVTPTITPTTTTTQIGQDRTPNDPYFSSLWGMHNTGQTGGTVDADIDAPAAWSMNTGSSSVVIAVIDSGVDYNHPDLAANIWTNTGEIPGNGVDDDHNGYIDDIRGWNFVSGTNNPMDDHSHGTHCSGTIAGVGNNGVGVVGVCWTAKIMPLKFLDSSGSG
ncbi:MAG: hypothetical protein CVV33_04170, partial [Methanomicrobiales archaeon HGW-Methanomicrobiales-4]